MFTLQIASTLIYTALGIGLIGLAILILGELR